MGGTETLKKYIIIKSLLNLNFLTLNQFSCDYSTVMQLNNIKKFLRISNQVRLVKSVIGCARVGVLSSVF